MEPTSAVSLAEAFDAIYRSNAWNGVESMSGPGSGSAATARVRDAIVELVAELGIRSVLDVGCGDGYWMPEVPGYVGIDVSEEAIAIARRRHPERTYFVGAPSRVLEADLVITRDAMQHLPLAAGVELLEAIRATGSRWLLASTYIAGANVDIVAGDAFWPDLSALPFGLGDPDRLIFDGYHYHETDEVRDPRKHLGLWRLA